MMKMQDMQKMQKQKANETVKIKEKHKVFFFSIHFSIIYYFETGHSGSIIPKYFIVFSSLNVWFSFKERPFVKVFFSLHTLTYYFTFVGEMGARRTGGARRTKAKTRIQKIILNDFDIEHRRERQNIVSTAIFDQDV